MNDDRFVKIAKALADPTRRKMIDELRHASAQKQDRRVTCTCLCDMFPLGQPTISHHVKTLEDAGLVDVERAGQFKLLSVNERTLAEFAASLLTPAAARKSTDSQPVRTTATRPRRAAKPRRPS